MFNSVDSQIVLEKIVFVLLHISKTLTIRVPNRVRGRFYIRFYTFKTFSNGRYWICLTVLKAKSLLENQILFFAHAKNSDYTCSKSCAHPCLHPFLHLQNFSLGRFWLWLTVLTPHSLFFGDFLIPFVFESTCEKKRLYVFQMVYPPMSTPVSTPVSDLQNIFPWPMFTMFNSVDSTITLFWKLFDSTQKSSTRYLGSSLAIL